MAESAKTVEPTAAPECGTPATGSKRCGAQLRGRPGVCCRQWAMVGKQRCARHGGLTPTGPANANFVHGAYSAALPKSLRRDFERYVNDPELISARTELAVLRCRLTALAARLGTGETGEAWGRLRKALVKSREACEARDADALRAALRIATDVTDDANNREQAAENYMTAVERFTAVCSREARRLVEARMTCSVEQVHAVFQALASAVLANVASADERRKIAADVNRLRILSAGELDEMAGGTGRT